VPRRHEVQRVDERPVPAVPAPVLGDQPTIAVYSAKRSAALQTW
jgi:hypothetical protein